MPDVPERVRTTREQGYTELDPAQLEDLPGKVQTVFQEDTCIYGMIRTFRVEKCFLSQETTDQGKVVFRFFPVLEEAQALIRSHLNTCANMWDGCGWCGVVPGRTARSEQSA